MNKREIKGSRSKMMQQQKRGSHQVNIPRRPRVAIIAGSRKTAGEIVDQLNGLFGQWIDFSGIPIKDWGDQDIDFDMVLISTHTIFLRNTPPWIKPGTVILVIRRTLTLGSWENVMAIPTGTRLLLVNDEKDSAEEAIALLYELGARHIECVAYYPGVALSEQLPIAITPGESHLVPDYVNQIVDIGGRVVDVGTMVDMLTQLNLLNGTTRNILSRYAENIVSRSQGLELTMKGLIHTKKMLQQTLNMVQDVVIGYDQHGSITLFNQEARAFFSCTAEEAQDVTRLLKQEGAECPSFEEEWKDVLTQIKKQKVILNNQHIITNGRMTGGVLTLKVAKRVEELELKLRFQPKGHVAKFGFHDLVTVSEKMKQIVQRAKKMASTDLNVLILGESGTGKELFAHAIHQSSKRANYPFVAVNCSALPDNLLESELFGYEDGAFTGAKKGGKPGLFEEAHKGTIFLDEIGDISPSLQSRLLRVIQQKEVLKVGGTRLFPIDVRIIAATNRDLSKLVSEGTFRDDLYYRLRVLQLDIPPLRERPEDIPYLATWFLERRGAHPGHVHQLKDALMQYPWPGNVRELENTMEYIAFMNEGSETLEDIPPFLQGSADSLSDRMTPHPDLQELPSEKRETLILQLIHQGRVNGQNTGRRALVRRARENGYVVTESDMRKALDHLRAAGLIEVTPGRAGCKLTSKGSAYLQEC
ncbi:AAA family ATPase [Brevibacillus panacihumi]|uniref:AAA family ATPase n=1 Tax=Brevibacillus panacihumi TaxID=497735 RepID=A0A3M8CMA8_9BACL|nr:AAA family ATPase [Brevibacillus panacihumi]